MQQLKEQVDAADTTSLYGAVWAPVAALFNDQRPGAKKVTWAIDTALQDKKLLVIDLSGKGSEGLYWNSRIQALTIPHGAR